MSLANCVPLSVVPCASVREPALLETSLELLADYATSAPQWRLSRWSFAATADAWVLVRGLPLPPLPGTQWVESGGVCVRAGYEWSPGVEPAVVRLLLELSAGDIALLRTDGSWDRIAVDDWVRAGRSSLRQLREAQ